jgi:hypothetical protein
MPPKSRYRRTPGGEPKTGLVITLVFFILATIGLGVATYYGFAEQQKLTKEREDAKKALETQKQAARYYKYLANQLSDYIGDADEIDRQEYASLKEEFASGKLGAGEGTLDKMKAKIDKLDKPKDGKGETDVSWDAANKKPKITYQKLVKDLNAANQALLAERDKAKEDAVAADTKRQDKEKLLEELRKEYQDKFNKVTKGHEDDLKKELANFDLLNNQINELRNLRDAAEKKAQETVAAADARAKKDQKAIRDLREARDNLQNQLEAIRTAKAEAPPTARTDWQIIRLDERGERPYINLGSADRVKPQLTFSIHSLGADGKLTPEPKGTLEVVTILGEHYSQARITSVRDRARNPILVGDVLYNPLWDPNLKKHVAIAGLVDLSGVSRDPEVGLQDFFRHLEKENVVVDAWVDPKSFTIKSSGKGVNLQTDLLIIGESSDFFTDGRERNVEISARLEKAINEMRRQAKENGVGVMALRKYLESIGYRVPPHLAGPSDVSPLYKPKTEVQIGKPQEDKDKGAPPDGDK